MKRTITSLSFLLVSVFFLSTTTILNVGGIIDLNDLENYADQDRPVYILKDNTPPNNPITDAGATLGRVLFYDKNLSVNNAIACASCHQQEFAFGDPEQVSTGQSGGVTGRHSMRLINARFGDEVRFFWDERAGSLEQQTTMPIQDHTEMGFSGENGDPDLDSLIRKMQDIEYYQTLFEFAFGTPQITEIRMQRAMAQFIRSIQSFDSKYDAGRAVVPNDQAPFPNFTPEENLGKTLFMTPSINGGAGCNGCHRAPEFDIDPNSLNNGATGVAGDPISGDFTNTRSPSLRDIFNPDGSLNGPLMHNGLFNNIQAVINHYSQIPVNPNNDNLDPRLAGPGGTGQSLNLSPDQRNALIAFLRTLGGNDTYTNEKWSDPFDENGDLVVVPFCGSGIITSVEAEICEGESFEGYTQTGTFEDVFTSENGCDSTRILHLTILPEMMDVVSAEICAGESFEGYTQTGIYEDIFPGSNGCDSVRTLALLVLPLAETELNVQICEGETYEGHDETGTYMNVFTAINGCDSTHILHLEVVPELTEFVEAEICEGESFEGYTEPGVYEDVFVSSAGCDSVRTLVLFVLPPDDPACSVSATEKVSDESSLAIFPNPFHDVFKIKCECSGNYRYSIFDSRGREVKMGQLEFAGGASPFVEVNGPSGIYFMKLKKENEAEEAWVKLLKN